MKRHTIKSLLFNANGTFWAYLDEGRRVPTQALQQRHRTGKMAAAVHGGHVAVDAADGVDTGTLADDLLLRLHIDSIKTNVDRKESTRPNTNLKKLCQGLQRLRHKRTRRHLR